jgi:hypothetical protein
VVASPTALLPPMTPSRPAMRSTISTTAASSPG